MARERTPHLLIAITTAVTLLAGAGAAILYSVFFPPSFRGWGEVTADGRIAGWVVNRAAPLSRVEVQLYIDGQFVSSRVADLPRPDVLAAGYAADEWCGYSFPVPPLGAGSHEARVYAMHAVGPGAAYRTLQLTGNPLRFTVGGDGSVTPAEP